jgi:DNA-directed RNA polymerase subunit RPC12/RpoP
MIEFRCHVCGKFLKLPQSYAGQTTECPGCRKTVHVPGAPPAAGPAQRPKPTPAAMQLCVDCGGSFPTGQMMQQNGQFLCTECFHQRKPIVLKYRKKRSRKVKMLFWLAVVAALGVGAWALWRFVLS